MHFVATLHLIVWVAKSVMKTRKQRIRQEALTFAYYDREYRRVVGASQVKKWIKNVDQSARFNDADDVPMC